jgi:hypothetical protein
MSSPVLSGAVSTASESGGAPSLPPGEAHALLRVGFDRFLKKLLELTAAAIDATDDLFEAISHVPDGEIESFGKSGRNG